MFMCNAGCFSLCLATRPFSSFMHPYCLSSMEMPTCWVTICVWCDNNGYGQWHVSKCMLVEFEFMEWQQLEEFRVSIPTKHVDQSFWHDSPWNILRRSKTTRAPVGLRLLLGEPQVKFPWSFLLFNGNFSAVAHPLMKSSLYTIALMYWT